MGSLTVVGTGIAFPAQATVEALDHMKVADIVYFNVGADNLAARWIADNAKQTCDLYQYYEHGVARAEAYAAMVRDIVESVQGGYKTVAAFYGHPGVFVGPGYKAMQRCRSLGYTAHMLPGVSAVDCMYADLEFDPAQSGVIMLEATQYLVSRVEVATSMPLILWQAGTAADETFDETGRTAHLDLLQEALRRHYPADHGVVAYMASVIPGISPSVQTGTVGGLTDMDIHASHTLLLPPVSDFEPDADVLERLRSRNPEPAA